MFTVVIDMKAVEVRADTSLWISLATTNGVLVEVLQGIPPRSLSASRYLERNVRRRAPARVSDARVKLAKTFAKPQHMAYRNKQKVSVGLHFEKFHRFITGLFAACPAHVVGKVVTDSWKLCFKLLQSLMLEESYISPKWQVRATQPKRHKHSPVFLGKVVRVHRAMVPGVLTNLRERPADGGLCRGAGGSGLRFTLQLRASGARVLFSAWWPTRWTSRL